MIPYRRLVPVVVVCVVALFSIAGCSGGCDVGGCVANTLNGCIDGCASCESCSSCSSCSSCASCESCEGCEVGPIAGGFDPAKRVQNAVQLRLTSSGIDFIEQQRKGILDAVWGALSGTLYDVNGDGVSDVPMVDGKPDINGDGVPDPGYYIPIPPQKDIDAKVGKANLCELNNGKPSCYAELVVKNLELLPVMNGSPDRLTVKITFNVYSIDPKAKDLVASRGAAKWHLRGTPLVPSCDIGYDTERGASKEVTISATVDTVNGPPGPRAGYAKLNLENIAFDPGALDFEDIQLTGLCGAGIDIFKGIFNTSKEDLADDLVNEVLPQVKETVANLCQPPTANPLDPTQQFCPTGSHPKDNKCVNDGDESQCVPLLLGLEARVNFGKALATFVPGSTAALDVLFAMQGEMHAGPTEANNGLNLDFYNGVQNVKHNDCVPQLDPPPLPQPIPADAFRGASDDAHINVGISTAFVNYALYQLFDSGALCIQATTDLEQMISTSLFGILPAFGNSWNPAIFPYPTAPLGIVMRPGAPPVLTLDDKVGFQDAMLKIEMKALSLDFYIWSHQRYVYVFTYRSDLAIGLNLTVDETGAITPTIAGVTVANADVKDSGFLPTVPRASDFALVFGALPAVAGGLIPTISVGELVGSALPIGISLPENGIQTVHQGDQSFIGIFPKLSVPGQKSRAQVDTKMAVGPVIIPSSEAITTKSLDRTKLPRVQVHFEAAGPEGATFEYSYRVDGEAWSPWSTDADPVITSPLFVLQLPHKLRVRARVAGDVSSIDHTPAEATVVIDALPPRLRLTPTATGVHMVASDVLTPDSELEYRTREPGGEWTAWTQTGGSNVDLPGASSSVEVEVRDKAGNVGTNVDKLNGGPAAGIPDPDKAGGCGCALPGSAGSNAPLGGAGLGLILGLSLWIRRRRRVRPAND